MKVGIDSEITLLPKDMFDLINLCVLSTLAKDGQSSSGWEGLLTKKLTKPESSLDEVVTATLEAVAEHAASAIEPGVFDEVIRRLALSIEERTGVRLRHWSWWRNRSINQLTSRINSMMVRNEQVTDQIKEDDVAYYTDGISDFGAFELLEDEPLREELRNDYEINKHEVLFLLLPVFDFYYLPIDSEDFQKEKDLTVENVCDYLTEKLEYRMENDGLVYYGAMPPAAHRYITRKRLFETMENTDSDAPIEFSVVHVEGALKGILQLPTMASMIRKSNDNLNLAIQCGSEQNGYKFEYGHIDQLIDDGWVLSDLDPLTELFGAEPIPSNEK